MPSDTPLQQAQQAALDLIDDQLDALGEREATVWLDYVSRVVEKRLEEIEANAPAAA